ncbi:hypothetical protein E2542_SST04677 [Spatholobus suberectus]|nr:hypothetical protein E2542_SST04677 [Spatholobus suberectus]
MANEFQAARCKILNVCYDIIKQSSNVPSQVAISLAKVADVDTNLGATDLAADEFQESTDLLEPLTPKSEASE